MTGYTEQAKGRKRRTSGEVAALEAAILAILRRGQPSSVRNVFYRLVVAGRVDKTEASYKQVIDRLGKMRTGGRVPYSWIVDSSRMGYHVPTFASIEEFQKRMANWYRSDIWSDVPQHVEVWCESRSLAGMLRTVCDELAISLYPTSGFPSMSQVWSAAQEMAATGKESAVLLYLGDYDPAGAHISEDLEAKLGMHLEGHGMGLTFRRLAVNLDQIERYRLPTRPRKAGEKRKASMSETVEAEALEPETLRAMVHEAALAYLPPLALEAARIADESERAHIARLGAA